MPQFIDLTGQKFNRLTVLRRVERLPAHGAACWLCRCACGGETVAPGTALRSGRRKSCGCINRDSATDLTARIFGRLTVLRRAGANRFGHPNWLCRCDCGKEKVVNGRSLAKGTTQSCGCLRALLATRHGGSDTPMYRVWASMIQRCENPDNASYADYGGRGIKVCERWHLFENFAADMGERPPGFSIDRKDNDGNYEPDNCRWATAAEQNRNQRRRKARSD